uniref:Phosphoribosyltransferase n=1 Tax=Thermofilum pendens TaxID=2269 RepID=A0A7J3X4U8_THEPE
MRREVEAVAVKLRVLGWKEFYEKALALALVIKDEGYKPDIIVAIARGGWVLGRILSDALGVRETASITIQYYRGIRCRDETPHISQTATSAVRERKVLLVDDVADTGTTLNLAMRELEKAGASVVRTTTLFVKEWTRNLPDYYLEVVREWVVFPYEYAEVLSELVRKGISRSELETMGFEKSMLNLLLKVVERCE